MDKFGEKEFKKVRKFIKNCWYDWCSWFINYNPKPIKNSKLSLISLFKSNTNKNFDKIVLSSRKKLSKPKIQKES